MKGERKFLFVFVLAMLVFSSVLVASPIVFTGTGSGNTEQKAVESARSSIAEQLFSGILSTTTITAASDNTETASVTFSRSSSYVVSGELPGLDYKVTQDDDDEYTAVMTLAGDEATIDFYEVKLTEMKLSAEEFYLRYSALSSSSPVSERREAIEKVIEYYSRYKLYCNVLLRIGGDISTSIAIPATIEVLLEDYQSLINEEDNYLVSADISETIRTQLDEKRKSQEEYNRIQEEARAQSELNRRLELENEIAKILEKGNSYSLLTQETAQGIDKLKDNVMAIKEANNILKAVSDGYDELIGKQTAEIEKSFQEESEAIWNRTYRIIDLDAAQNPTLYAKSVREKEIEELRKRKDKEKEEALSIINERLRGEIQSAYDNFVLAVKHLNEEKYLISSEDGDISLADVSGYDGSKFCWRISIVSDYYVIEGIKIDIRSVTGLKIPSDNSSLASYLNSDAGIEYSNAVSKYSALLKNSACAFTISFSAKFIPGINQLTITLAEFDFEFADGIGTTVSLSSIGDLVRTINLEESNYRSYSWLKKDYSIKDSVVEATRKHPIRDFLNSNVAWGVNFSLGGFDFDGIFPIIFGLEVRRYCSFFFVSASCKYGLAGIYEHEKSDAKVKTGDFSMFEIALGAGIRFLNDYVTLGCSMAVNLKDGIMLYPYVAVCPHVIKNEDGTIGCMEFRVGTAYNSKHNKMGILVELIFADIKYNK